MKLLIADDDRQIRSGLAESINWLSHGIDIVLTAADGLEALKLFKQEKPEIVLTDIQMPGLDGLELSKEIQKLSIPATVIILSGFSDFDYARQALRYGVKDYLLKPVEIDALIEIVIKARDLSIKRTLDQKEQQQLTMEYIDKILTELLWGSRDGKEQLMLQLFEHWQINPKSQIKVALVEVDQAWKYPVQTVLVKLGAQIENILESLTDETFIAACRHDDRIIAVTRLPFNKVFTHTFDPSSKILYALCKRLELPTTFTIAFSRPGAADTIQDLYQQAYTAIQDKLYMGHGQLLLFGHTRMLHPDFQIDQKKMRLLEQAVWDLDPAQASDLLCAIFTEIRTAHQANKARIDQICRHLKESLIDIVKAQGFDFEGLFGSNLKLFENRVGLETLNEYEFWIAGLFEIVLTGLSELKGAKTSVSIRRAAEFILQNFSDNITLEEVAESVQKSPNYFSHLFKKVIGISFSEYLNRIRIQEAKKLLRTTHLLAYEIAEKVGFQDYKYFNQVFRKLEGCSPNNYRKGAAEFHSSEIL